MKIAIPNNRSKGRGKGRRGRKEEGGGGRQGREREGDEGGRQRRKEVRLAVEEQQEAVLNNWTTGEQVETQCSVYVLSVGSGGQRERRWKDTERVAYISYNPSDLNPRSMYHKLIL